MNERLERIDKVMVETIELQSELLKRSVRIDFYHSEQKVESGDFTLMLVNDGQDLAKMNFQNILATHNTQSNLLVAGIHGSAERNHEYGMSAGPNIEGMGSRAGLYESFVVDELLPFIRSRFHYLHFSNVAFAGFSLGGLSAFDIAWNNPLVFSKAVVFSGSFWWRSVDKQHKSYDPWLHRMMHRQVAESDRRVGMKFFFSCGDHDEGEDRNRNGVIDSIDDTIDLMRLLIRKDYLEGRDFFYVQVKNGKHDLTSWAKAWEEYFDLVKRVPDA
jgi:enterochelin esterase-like enzyme